MRGIRTRTRARTLVAVALTCGVVFAAGCAPAPSARLVKIVDDGRAAVYFEPSSLEIPVGTEVRWRNAGARVQVVATDAADIPPGAEVWDSGALRAGETFSHRFETPGIYLYRGDDDSGLVGTIEVRE